jgi:hypothetical protein
VCADRVECCEGRAAPADNEAQVTVKLDDPAGDSTVVQTIDLRRCTLEIGLAASRFDPRVVLLDRRQVRMPEQSVIIDVQVAVQGD